MSKVFASSILFFGAYSFAATMHYKTLRESSGIAKKEQKMIIDAIKKVIADSCNSPKQGEPSHLEPTPFLRQKRGVFVTLYKNGALRGCMGRIIPDKPLYRLIPEVAQLSAFEDPRFPAVRCDELNTMTIMVSVLTKPRKVDSYNDIIIGTHGIILHHGSKSAVFLSKIAAEQGWNLRTTLSHLARKAGLPANAWQDPHTTFEVFESIDFPQASR